MMKLRAKLSQESIYLRLNNKAFQVYPNQYGRIITDDRTLAHSFGKEVLIVPYIWV